MRKGLGGEEEGNEEGKKAGKKFDDQGLRTIRLSRHFQADYPEFLDSIHFGREERIVIISEKNQSLIAALSNIQSEDTVKVYG